MSSPKRHARPAESQSTADHYGRLHGIPDDVQAALQNVGRRNRQFVSMGRPFVPTQSAPVLSFGGAGAAVNAASSNGYYGGAGNNIFVTEADAHRTAQGIITKELLRSNELQPYASNDAGIDALDLAAHGGRPSEGVFIGGPDALRGFKRDPTDLDAAMANDSASPSLSPSGSASPAFTFTASVDDFPPVPPALRSKSPLANPESASRAMPPPPLPAGMGMGGNRATRAMPRRNPFSKTMSAPVGRLGTWSGMDIDGSWVPGNPANINAGADGIPIASGAPAGAVGGAGLVVSAVPAPVEEEDGFDVAEWAKSEEF